MGSSADSCDSETTVTSLGEDHVTPTAQDQPYFNESEEESLASLQKGKAKVEIVAEKRKADNQDFPQCVTAENAGNNESMKNLCEPGPQITETGEHPPLAATGELREGSGEE